MKKFLTLIIILTSNLLYAQIENALSFDNVDDKVEIMNASALVANSPNISLSFWVKPMNANPLFPDLDGFSGFRNDVDCDFYVVQLNSTDVEARFRNSTGTAFSITSTTLLLNQWQNYVLTYDGSLMRLYHNGTLTDSASANGTIASTTQSLNIGNLVYSINNFYLSGLMDEVSLWNKTLSASEIECIFKSYVDSTDSGLLLYYKFNQGTLSGSNPGIDTLIPTTGNLSGVLYNFNLNGPTSNWVSGLQNYTAHMDVFCPGTPYVFGSQTISNPGVYYEAFTGSTGCDSVVRLNLTSSVNDSVSVYADSLQAFQANATYQWLDCDNNYSVLTGATGRSYSPSLAGNYAVQVIINNCTDTSDCVNFIPTGINSSSSNRFKLISNPVNDRIDFNQRLNDAEIIITNVEGKIVGQWNNVSDKTLDVSSINSGIYIVTIKEGISQNVFRIVKQ